MELYKYEKHDDLTHNLRKGYWVRLKFGSPNMKVEKIILPKETEYGFDIYGTYRRKYFFTRLVLCKWEEFGTMKCQTFDIHDLIWPLTWPD